MPTPQNDWFTPLGSPWIPPTSPLSRVINYPRTAVRSAWEGLKDWGKEAVTPEQPPNLTEPRTADWPAATSIPAMGEVEKLLPTPKGSGVPSAYDPTKMAGGKGMSPWGDAPKTNETPGALAGLQAAGASDPYIPGRGMGGPKINVSGTEMGGGSTGTGGFGIPTTLQGVSGGYGNMEEVMRLANADPGTTAPGASDYWQGELQDRLEPQEYNKLLARKQQETIMAGLTSAHPAVLAQSEREAGYTAAPAMANMQGQRDVASINAHARMVAAQITAAAGSQSHYATIAAGLLRSIGQISASPQATSTEGQEQLIKLQDQLDTIYAQLGGVPQGAQ
jgi:hypothetical protein